MDTRSSAEVIPAMRFFYLYFQKLRGFAEFGHAYVLSSLFHVFSVSLHGPWGWQSWEAVFCL